MQSPLDSSDERGLFLTGCHVATVAPSPRNPLTALRSLLHLLLLSALVALPAGAAELRHDGLDDVSMERLREAMRSWQPMAQAWFRLRAGDAQGALMDAKRLARERPKSADAWHLVGIASAAAGKPMAAEQALRRSLRLAPDGWVAMHLTSNLLDRDRVAAADRVLRKVEGGLPTDAQFTRALAWVFVARGEIESARDLLQSLEGETREAVLSWQLSTLLAAEGDAPAALEAIRRAVANDPEHPVYRRELFERLVATGDWSGLVAATKERGADAVGGGLAPYYKGIGLLRLGKTDAAIVAFSEVVEHGRPEPAPLAGAAGYLLQLGAYLDAERAARAALKGAEEDAPLHHLLAMSLTRVKREGEALAHYRRAAELSEENANYRFDLLVSLCSLSRTDELTVAIAGARRDFPEDERLDALESRCVVPGS